MINSITSFEIGSSVFDLAVQSFVQWLILFYLGYKSESRALSSLSKSTPSSWRLPAVLGVVLSCLGFLYSVIKVSSHLHFLLYHLVLPGLQSGC